MTKHGASASQLGCRGAVLLGSGLDPSHRFHDLRHTFATRLASQGVPMRSLQGARWVTPTSRRR